MYRIIYKHGLTFLEIVFALSVLLVALLGLFQMLDTALNSSYRATQESIAINLARGLMSEIMSKDFEEPGSGSPPPPLGRDANESVTNRSTFDDVDDYHGYSESPPRTVNGTPMNGTAGTPNYSRFSRNARAVYCNVTGGSIVEVGGPSNYKKITVAVNGTYVRNINIDELKAK